MMGLMVSDPEHTETQDVTDIAGMGLLEMKTTFHGEKVQIQTRGEFTGIEGMLKGLNGVTYEGYEIHMGRSEINGSDITPPAVMGTDNIYGSYIHGIFDAPGITDEILKAICEKKGIDFTELGSFDLHEYKELQYDKLADAVRSGLDMEYVYKILNGEV